MTDDTRPLTSGPVCVDRQTYLRLQTFRLAASFASMPGDVAGEFEQLLADGGLPVGVMRRLLDVGVYRTNAIIASQIAAADLAILLLARHEATVSDLARWNAYGESLEVGHEQPAPVFDDGIVLPRLDALLHAGAIALEPDDDETGFRRNRLTLRAECLTRSLAALIEHVRFPQFDACRAAAPAGDGPRPPDQQGPQAMPAARLAHSRQVRLRADELTRLRLSAGPRWAPVVSAAPTDAAAVNDVLDAIDFPPYEAMYR